MAISKKDDDDDITNKVKIDAHVFYALRAKSLDELLLLQDTSLAPIKLKSTLFGLLEILQRNQL